MGLFVILFEIVIAHYYRLKRNYKKQDLVNILLRLIALIAVFLPRWCCKRGVQKCIYLQSGGRFVFLFVDYNLLVE